MQTIKYKKNIYNSNIMIDKIFFRFLQKNKKKLKMFSNNIYYMRDCFSYIFLLTTYTKYELSSFVFNNKFYFKNNTIILDAVSIKKIAKSILSFKEFNSYRYNIHLKNIDKDFFAVNYLVKQKILLENNASSNHNDLLDLGIFGIFGITLKSLTKHSKLFISNNNIALQIFFQDKYYTFIVLNNL